MLTLLTIAGGVALILFGVRFLRKGLDRLFGTRLGQIMQRAANRPVKAFFTGLGVSILAPSSTTISVLAVNTVQSGHLTPRQTLAVMFGADIGLTAMVLLISLRLDSYAPLLALVGVLLFQFTRSTRSRGIGQVLVSLSFIFLGIGTIKQAVAGIESNGDLTQIITIAEHYPWALALVAALMAVALQSSTATIGLVLGLSAADRVSLPAAVAVVCGANVGIAITTLVVGWSKVESRRLALGNLLAKGAVAGLMLEGLHWVVLTLDHVPAPLSQRIALSHTGFNVLVALLGLPLIVPLSRLVEALAPKPPATEDSTFGPRYINGHSVDSAALALGMSMREIMHVGEIVRAMLDDLWTAVRTNNAELARKVSRRDDQVDLLDQAIKKFLTTAVILEGDADDAAEQTRQLRYLNELETIGDIIDKNLCDLAQKKVRLNITFTAQGADELEDFFAKVRENLLIADTAFTSRDRELAQKLLTHKEFIREYDRALRDRHFARLKSGEARAYESSAIHLDLLTHLKRINSHVTHVAYAILLENPQTPPGPRAD